MTSIVSTLAGRTYEAVRRQILTGDMAPNSPVRQDVIAEKLGVSTIPLREALGRLEQDGFLTSYPNRGYVVRPLSDEEMTEVFTLRFKLEPRAVAESAMKAGEHDRAVVRAALANLEAAQHGGQSADHVTANRQFHMALIRPGAGLLTIQILERLHLLAERYVRVHLQPLGRDERAVREHQDLMSCWENRSVVRVEKLAAEHIYQTLIDLRKQICEFDSDESPPVKHPGPRSPARTAVRERSSSAPFESTGLREDHSLTRATIDTRCRRSRLRTH